MILETKIETSLSATHLSQRNLRESRQAGERQLDEESYPRALRKKSWVMSEATE